MLVWYYTPGNAISLHSATCIVSLLLLSEYLLAFCILQYIWFFCCEPGCQCAENTSTASNVTMLFTYRRILTDLSYHSCKRSTSNSPPSMVHSWSQWIRPRDSFQSRPSVFLWLSLTTGLLLAGSLLDSSSILQPALSSASLNSPVSHPPALDPLAACDCSYQNRYRSAAVDDFSTAVGQQVSADTKDAYRYTVSYVRYRAPWDFMGKLFVMQVLRKRASCGRPLGGRCLHYPV